MKKIKKCLAIIPARSGSKGLKNKNIKLLKGKPLIAYTIESAIKSEVFEDIIVTTDSEQYKKISEEYGAWVPFLRSEGLSNDEASTNDVIEDVLYNLEKMGKTYDSFMLLQPTSPLRDKDDICASFEQFYSKKCNSLVSMSECDHSPVFSKQLGVERRLDGFLDNISKVRRQDMNPYYRLNGAIYIVKVEYFMRYKNFYKENSFAYIMEKSKSIDIDDELDFKIAEFLMDKK